MHYLVFLRWVYQITLNKDFQHVILIIVYNTSITDVKLTDL